MEITNLFNPNSPVFILFFFLNLSIAWSTFAPIDNYLLDCGSSRNSVINNRNFIADSSNSCLNFLSATSTSIVSIEEETPSPSLSPVHHTARIFTKPSNYVFEIKNKGTHVVRLHFFPFNSSKINLSDSLFHVSVNGYLLLSNFNGLESQKNGENPILKEYFIWAESGKLEIVFTPWNESSFGFVNAIEVFSAPGDLIADTALFVNSEGNQTVHGLTHQALETVYRLNVGGPKVTPFNDTLWRTWIPDDQFLESSNESKGIHFGGRIKYQNGGLSREVGPDNVYSSARVMSNATESSPSLNVTWILPVNVGYKYLVRMHFCDIASMTLYELYFNVYINGNLAYENLDLSKITLMLASPYYADFVVDADNSGVISVSISPSSQSSTARINALLNGLEVMKMNNSMGSLDGEKSLASIMKIRPSGNTGSFVPAVAISSLLIAAFAIMYRRRSTAQDSVGWSQLPLDASEGNLKYGNQPLSRKFQFF